MKLRLMWACLLAFVPLGSGGLHGQGFLAGRMMTAPRAMDVMQVRTTVEYQSIESYLRAGDLPAVLARTVTLRVEDQPLEQVLEEIVKQAALQISYADELVQSRTRVSLAVQNVSAAEALSAAARVTGWMVFATPEGRVTVLRSKTRDEQRATITGRVIDAATEQPLSGASVQVMGTNYGSLSGSDGRYSLTGISAGTHRVRASLIGYAAMERSVTVSASQTANVDFALNAGALELEGIVAVGYGTQQRRDVTGAVASINSAELDAIQVPTVAHVLQGRAAGVEVTQNSSAPGGSVSIRVRGSGSMSATNEPLYVIDGIPVSGAESGDLNSWERTGYMNPIAFLNPDDIASIDVLKDASATAIYGARGTNGVVLITTKHGRAGVSRLEFESSLAMQQRPPNIPVLNARDYAEAINFRARTDGVPEIFDLNNLPAETDWQDLVLRNAPIQQYTMRMLGGSDQTRFAISGHYTDHQGVVRSSELQRYGLRANLDHQAKDWLRLGSNVSITRVNNSQGQTDAANRVLRNSSVLGNAMGFLPTIPVYRENGEYTWSDVDYPAEYGRLGLRPQGHENPVALVNEHLDEGLEDRVLGNLFAEATLADGLRLRLNGGANIDNSSRKQYWSSDSRRGAEAGGGIGTTGSVEQSHYLGEAILTYSNGFGELHDLDFMTGVTYEKDEKYVERITNSGFPNDVTRIYSIGDGNRPGGPSVGSDWADWTLMSYLGRVNYGLADKYLLTLTGRADGSSKFGAENKWALFPSGAFAWRASEEPFLRGLDWLSELKFRVSYGLTGNQEIGTYASLARLRSADYVFGGTSRVSGYYPGSIGNPELRWEKSEQLDAGLDATLFDNRVSLTLDVYRKLTDDLLLNVPLPFASGFSSAVRNIGSIENKGFEAALGIAVLEGFGTGLRGVGWRSNFNLSVNRNKVLDLGGVDALSFRDRTMVMVGEPIGVFFMYKIDGLFRSQEEVDAYVGPDGKPIMPGVVPGQVRYVDVNGDGRITSDDRTIIGDPNPDFTGGWTNEFTLGAFSLSSFLQGSYGNDVYNFNLHPLAPFQPSGRANIWADAWHDAWSEENPDGSWPIFDIPPGQGYRGPGTVHDWYIQDGSYLRLRNVTLTYSIPGRAARWLAGMQSGRVYLSADNLHTWTNYNGLNPDVNSNSQNNVARGIDRGAYPLSKVFRLGLSFAL